MVALYRSGRQAEALAVYERLRRTLDEELGLQPSAELQRLSGQIVRQDEQLDATAAFNPSAQANPPSRSRRRLALIAAAIAAALLAAAAGLAVVAGAGGDPRPSVSERIALVVPQDPEAEPHDAVLTAIVDGLHRAERHYGVETEILVGDEFNRQAPSSRHMLERLRTGRFGLVLAFGGLGEAVTPLARTLPSTHFAFFDRGPKLRNGTTFVFGDEDAGYLAGYLSGLVEGSRGPRQNDAHVVSMIGGIRGVSVVERLLTGFERGARDALPDVKVLRAYSDEFADTSPCEALANRQVDRGSDIVFAAAGRCSLGALAATAIRGVWGVGVDSDQSSLGNHVLVSTVKRYDEAVFYAVRSFVQGNLDPGTVELGLREEAVGIVGIGSGVAEPIRRRVASLAWEMRKRNGD
jgi:basic membrane protein A